MNGKTGQLKYSESCRGGSGICMASGVPALSLVTGRAGQHLVQGFIEVAQIFHTLLLGDMAILFDDMAQRLFVVSPTRLGPGPGLLIYC